MSVVLLDDSVVLMWTKLWHVQRAVRVRKLLKVGRSPKIPLKRGSRTSHIPLLLLCMEESSFSCFNAGLTCVWGWKGQKRIVKCLEAIYPKTYIGHRWWSWWSRKVEVMRIFGYQVGPIDREKKKIFCRKKFEFPLEIKNDLKKDFQIYYKILVRNSCKKICKLILKSTLNPRSGSNL